MMPSTPASICASMFFLVHARSMLKSALNLVVTAGSTPSQICATAALLK